jgi:anti-sigma B factor antagonist
MEYKRRSKGDHTIYELKGNLDIYSAPKVKKDITMSIDKDRLKSVTLDMSSVTHMDSSGIALLANLHKKMKSTGNTFALLSVTNDIMAILRLSSLDSFFTIYSSEDEIK